MFKKLVTLALVPAALFAGEILDTKPGHFQVGVHGGPSFKDFDTRAKTGINSNNGYMFGAHVEIGGKYFSVQPEVNYAVRGFEVANTANVEHRYLEVPVLLKAKFSPWQVQPILAIGPNFSARLDSKVSPIGGASFANQAEKYDVSAVGVAGFAINLVENLTLDLVGRYTHGFRDLDKSTLDVKTQSVQFITSASAKF